MNNKEIFDLLKTIFSGFDICSEISYKTTCENLQISNIPNWQKEQILQQLNYMHQYRKNFVNNGKLATDLSEYIYNICQNNK